MDMEPFGVAELFRSYKPKNSHQNSRDSIADRLQGYTTSFAASQTDTISPVYNAPLSIYLTDSNKIQTPFLGHISPVESRSPARFHDQKNLVDPGPPLSYNIVDFTESFYDGLIPVDCGSPAIPEGSQQISEYSGLQLA